MSTKYTCTMCGGSDILWDAWAEWDGEEFVLHSVFGAYCNDCELGCDTETDAEGGAS